MGNCFGNDQESDKEPLTKYKGVGKEIKERRQCRHITRLQEENKKLAEEIAQLQKLREEEQKRSERMTSYLMEEIKGWIERKNFADMLEEGERQLDEIIKMQNRRERGTQTSEQEFTDGE